MKINPVILATVVILVTVLGAGVAVYALQTLQETGSWTISEASFTISTVPPFSNPRDLGVVSPTDTKQIIYTITNNGNVPITVLASASAVNATATLSKTSTANLAVGASDIITLTLSAFTYTGTYQITFNKA